MTGWDSPAETSTAKIETTASDGWHAAIALHGEVDAEVAPALHAELQGHLAAGRYFIRINAGGVTFLDSTALAAVVTAAQRCADERGALILTKVPTPVWRIIQITGLDTVLLVDTACDSQARDLT